MREEYERILGEELRYLAIETRERLGLTQKEMGKRLQMCESSYSDIETGRSACGALTKTLLLNIQDEPKEFLDRVMAKFLKCYEQSMELTPI